MESKANRHQWNFSRKIALDIMDEDHEPNLLHSVNREMIGQKGMKQYAQT